MSFIQTFLRFAVITAVLGGSAPLLAQSVNDALKSYLTENRSKWSLSETDIQAWSISDQYSDRTTGLTYAYLQQELNGLPIFNAISSTALRDGKVVHFASRMVPKAASKANAADPRISASAAVVSAAQHLGLSLTEQPVGEYREGDRWTWHFGPCGIAEQEIRAHLTYVQVGDRLRLAWNVNIPLLKGDDWWNIRVDAETGQFLEKNNWTVYCQFDHPAGTSCSSQERLSAVREVRVASPAVSNVPVYGVFELPLEAPSFGPRTVVAEPNSADASPFGWLDVDGQVGVEYKITRGNNVHAYEDRDDDNQPGYSPSGGDSLNFNFPMDLTNDALTNEDGIIANLFYMNNMIHDILYHHGFTEEAGNFQENNYGRGGEDGDYVRAEAQDGSGSNNANFSTPDDGNRPRMQMYLWDNPVTSGLKVISPSSIAGVYTAAAATFGPGLGNGVTGSVVLVQDSVGISTDGCEALLNTADLVGKIALIDRSSCPFSDQVKAANNAGAIGVVVVNNLTTPPSAMGGNSDGITIPSVMIGKITGDSIKARLAAGEEVEVSMRKNPKYDSALDNGVIAHEYGHGLSNRLTGGPSASGCLSNREQGGEGWSDWLALILSIEPDDTGADARGIGTHLLGENTSGEGIRRFRYSTNMNINPQVYGDVSTSGVPHPIGEIWCQSIWDLTWKLIETEGFDPDWYYGNGGNNTAMRLVIEGMKLQPCRPGYIDARDAILAADALLYNNAHQCLIWEVFTRRGYGKGADQGSNDETNDQVESYTLPNICLTPTAPPTAKFAVSDTSSCRGVFQFRDLSTDIPQYYQWNFGDGSTSTEENPWHTYQSPGIYTVVLVVSNTLGESTHTLTVEYTVDPAPTVTGDAVVCAGNPSTLTASVQPGYSAVWYQNGELKGEGSTFTSENLLSTTVFEVKQFAEGPQARVGAADNTIGGGGYQSGGQGRLLFEAYAPFRLLSAVVYAQNAGNRTFNLYDNTNAIIQTVTVEVPEGQHRVALNFDIPAAGLYAVGGAGQKLYRNVTGAVYPYTIDSLVSIYSSNFSASPTSAYFYLYDWEVRYCYSEPTLFQVEVTPGPVAAFTASTVNGLNIAFENTTTGTATSYSWDFGDGTSVSNVQNPLHTYLTPGLYTVKLTVSDGTCSSEYELVVPVGVSAQEEPVELASLRLYPNPATDQFFLELGSQPVTELQLELQDAAGRTLKQQVTSQKRTRIEVEGLPAGVYQLRITSPSGMVVRKITLLN